MLAGTRQGTLPATCLRRAVEGAGAPALKMMLHHQYLAELYFQYFSFAYINPFLGGKVKALLAGFDLSS